MNRGRFLIRLKQTRHLLSLPADELDDWQRDKCQELLTYALTHSAYYAGWGAAADATAPHPSPSLDNLPVIPAADLARVSRIVSPLTGHRCPKNWHVFPTQNGVRIYDERAWEAILVSLVSSLTQDWLFEEIVNWHTRHWRLGHLVVPTDSTVSQSPAVALSSEIGGLLGLEVRTAAQWSELLASRPQIIVGSVAKVLAATHDSLRKNCRLITYGPPLTSEQRRRLTKIATNHYWHLICHEYFYPLAVESPRGIRCWCRDLFRFEPVGPSLVVTPFNNYAQPLLRCQLDLPDLIIRPDEF